MSTQRPNLLLVDDRQENLLALEAILQGLGHELIFYLQNRDYAAVQGIIVVFALVVVAVSVLIDLVSAAIDPRIRY